MSSGDVNSSKFGRGVDVDQKVSEPKHVAVPGVATSSSEGITPVQQMISSCTGALMTSFFVTPLDVVKIRLQAQQQAFKPGSCFIYSNGLMDCLCMCSHCNNGTTVVKDCKITIQPWYNKPGKFSGTLNQHNVTCPLHGKLDILHCSTAASIPTERPCLPPRPPYHLNGTLDAFVKIARYEGLGSLWSGLPPTLVMSIPATVFYFTSYDHLKYYMGYREGDARTRYVPLLAGSTARVGTVILISPLELIRTKMQSEQLSYREVSKAIRVSLRQDGPLSLMRGVGPTLLRDVPFSAIYWFGYEYVKTLQMSLQGNQQVTFSQSFIAGASAGSFAALVTVPFDVVKTHRQIQMGKAELLKGTKIVSTYTVLSDLYRQNGVRALFTGLVPRLSKVAPACAIMISTYEYFKIYFRTKNAIQSQDTIRAWT